MKKVLILLVAVMLLGVAGVDAQARKKAPRKAAKPAAAAFDVSQFNGTFANSYSDGIGGTVTDYLTLTVDPATGVATGEHKNERGETHAITGKLQGRKLICTYVDSGDEFADISIINANTLKCEGFTGTFKRVEGDHVKPAVDIATPVQEAPVDPAYELIKDRNKK